MITISDSLNTIETNKNYFIINENPYLLKYYKNKFNSKFVKKNFRYSSDKNSNFLTIKQLKSIVNKYVVSKNPINYSRQNINKNDIENVKNVLKSNFLTQGPKVEEFEKEINKFCKSRYSVACNSATSGLHISCLALGLKK